MCNWLVFLYHRLKEQLWVKPAVICCISVVAVFAAKWVDQFPALETVPNISIDSIETLLQVIAASMLVMATFAVGSMVSAYASASKDATPRTFPLIISDDVSQNALTAFVGAFIFSIVGLFALQNGYYERAGRFTLLIMTFAVFAVVILTFVWWVDRIARLGRMGTTIDKVELTTSAALKRRRKSPQLGGKKVGERAVGAVAVIGEEIGYVQMVKMDELQELAEKHDVEIELMALPGTFASPARALAFFEGDVEELSEFKDKVSKAFVIGRDRTFEDDPRFGLVVLSEIAGRALSPAINDSGTAIAVIGALVRLLVFWAKPEEEEEVQFDRVAVPELSLEDMFDDAFRMISRDGAGAVEVMMRLQKGFSAIAAVSNEEAQKLIAEYSDAVIKRAEVAIDSPKDLEAVKAAAQFT
ncbi:DUF2254 domain-containing protein [Rubritalea spongiae]|uniref:DUF2254 domain-containing protein n=1 Tax=Rubritalea spongiae TaxID=430797 RepID=A0ABW5E2W8_9BACT